MATDDERELKLALGCGASDPHWNAVIKCLQEWRASGINYKEYDWDHKIFRHAYICMRNLFAGYSNDEQLKRAKLFRDDVVRRLTNLYERLDFPSPSTLPSPHSVHSSSYAAESTSGVAVPSTGAARLPGRPVITSTHSSPSRYSPILIELFSIAVKPCYRRFDTPRTTHPAASAIESLPSPIIQEYPVEPDWKSLDSHTSRYQSVLGSSQSQSTSLKWFSRQDMPVGKPHLVLRPHHYMHPSFTPRQPVTYSCSPPSPENAYIRQAIAKDFDLAQLVPSLASHITAASTPLDAERIIKAADNVNKSSVRVEESLSLYACCMHDVSTGRDNPSADAMNGPFPSFSSHRAAWMTSLAWQLQGYMHDQTTEISTLRGLLPTIDSTSPKGSSHKNSAEAVTELINVLRQLHQAVKWTTTSLSQFRQRTDPKSQDKGKNKVSDTDLQPFHKTFRLEAEEALKNRTRMAEERDQFLFRGEKEERMINAQQPIKEGVLKG
ncbi:MAG: hypothetical protein Q9209_005857 [Squamulea sp. 1 TL-2023]